MNKVCKLKNILLLTALLTFSSYVNSSERLLGATISFVHSDTVDQVKSLLDIAVSIGLVCYVAAAMYRAFQQLNKSKELAKNISD